MGSLTDIEKQTIVDMKQSGAKLKDIVAETGRNSITIRNYLTSQGFPLYNKRISNDEKELIIKLFEWVKLFANSKSNWTFSKWY